MAYDGEAIKAVFTLVKENPNPTPPDLDILPNTYNTCCADELIHVFAHPDGDEFKNDKTTVIKSYSNAVTAVTMTLQEFTANTGWTDLVVLTNSNTLGTYYPLGFVPNQIAYTIDWFEVLDFNGIGSYRVRFDAVSYAGTNTTYSDQYCLTVYNALSANGTVKIEWRLNGEFADPNNDKKTIDYATSNLYQQIRLHGIFGKPSSEKAEEFIRYQNGQELFVKSEQTPEYTLELKPQTPEVLKLIQYQLFQQDSLLITDYNRNNHYLWIQKEVKITSGYAPEWDFTIGKASVELKLTNTYNNFKRRL